MPTMLRATEESLAPSPRSMTPAIMPVPMPTRATRRGLVILPGRPQWSKVIRRAGWRPADAPTGRVTLLATDIEGSTDLVRELGDGYADVLRTQQRLVRDAARAAHGYEVDTQGDSFLFAFQDALDALDAALAMQCALRDALPCVHVRMGLHTGQPTLVDGRYIGLDVHRAARVGSAAHGGQVVVSDTTFDLVISQLPKGVTLRDLGEHHLKDLRRARRLYQLVAPDLPDQFPPLRSLDAHRHNLPAQATPLIGRTAEARALKALLAAETTRLVTLSGPGGVGKTRLAVQVAADSAGDYPDGVVFVPLAAVSDPAQVPAAMADALGLTTTDDEALAVVVSHLRDRRSLLVLDNFEQVASAGPVVTALLAAAPGVKALVTSRIVLRVYGECEVTVPPLRAPQSTDELAAGQSLAEFPAVELFMQRAQAVQPNFALTANNAAAVACICARLDGLPLAIELAAARSRLLTPRAILAQLEQGRLRALNKGMADRPTRHQTLRASIDWSYDLLDEARRADFRRLAVFADGFRLDAAHLVCDTTDATLPIADAVEALLDASLLQPLPDPDGEPRFGMLETIREYALERLAEAGEASRVRERLMVSGLTVA